MTGAVAFLSRCQMAVVRIFDVFVCSTPSSSRGLCVALTGSFDPLQKSGCYLPHRDLVGRQALPFVHDDFLDAGPEIALTYIERLVESERRDSIRERAILL